ncbi:hypothetical protein B0H12DRAFT_1025668, partial [Mycena haematopus]
MHWGSFAGPRGERVRWNGTWDTGCDVGGMDKTWYLARAERMGELGPPKRILKMADGSHVRTYGQWTGGLEVKGVWVESVWDVFDSGGGWDVLVGKPVMAKLGAVHDIRRDIITIDAGGKTATLEN